MSCPQLARLSCVAGLAALQACSGDAQPAGTPTSGALSGRGSGVWFTEVARESGLDFVHIGTHGRRYWMPEISSGGLALLDFDNSGHLDLYCVQSGDLAPSPERPNEPNRLFKNRGDGTFLDVTEQAGVGDNGYGHGCATGDFDGDGNVDLFVANVGPNVLYRNRGDGTFEDVTGPAGVADSAFSTACTFLDYNANGELDLFVVNNLNWSPAAEIVCRSAQAERDYCSPKNYNAPSRDVLYRNDGDGTFTDISREAGILAATGIGLGVVAADFDGDGHVDIYVANDSVPNVLWINDGRGGFTDQALMLGCAVDGSGLPEASMGVQAVDIDDNGTWDLFMTHVRDETNTFYFNRNGQFTDRTVATGLAAPSRRLTGFGLGFHDFDHDGHLDLFVANGAVDLARPYFRDDLPYAEPNQLFRGLGGARFEEISAQLSVPALVGTSRAAAFGDIDNDGDIDIVYLDLDGAVHLLRNDSPKRGRWLTLRVVDERGVDQLGASVRVRAGDHDRYRSSQTSYSYCAANDPRVHFGLGDVSAVQEVQVTWPGGAREDFGALELDRHHTLLRGGGATAPGGAQATLSSGG